MVFGPVFEELFEPIFEEEVEEEALWLAGGVPAASCAAAYIFKGAGSYAAAKVNRNDPGTNDAANGLAYPTWAAGSGCTVNAALSQYLTTGLVPTSGWSAIVRVANFTKQNGVFAFGVYNSGDSQGMLINPSRADDRPVFYNGGSLTPASGGLTEGVFAVAGNKAYVNGVLQAGTMAAWTTTADDLYIGCYRRVGVGAAAFCSSDIYLAWYYNTDISAFMAELTAAALSV